MGFNDVMTTTEAAKRWGISPTTIKLYCLGTKSQPPKFRKEEFRKSGKAWLVTKAGMERLYGPEPGTGKS